MNQSTIDAMLEAYEDLKDIINAADIGQPYGPTVLKLDFNGIHKLREELLKAGVVPPGEKAHQEGSWHN